MANYCMRPHDTVIQALAKRIDNELFEAAARPDFIIMDDPYAEGIMISSREIKSLLEVDLSTVEQRLAPWISQPYNEATRPSIYERFARTYIRFPSPMQRRLLCKK